MKGIANLDPSFFDHEHTIVNFSNSILKHYGAETHHSSIKEVDEALKGHRKVAVFLFDAMGEYIQDSYSKICKTLIDHRIATMFSTNPATTSAATNALMSAKFPAETGWIGWSLYHRDIDKTICVLPNKDFKDGSLIPGPNIMYSKCHYETIKDQLVKVGVKADFMLPFPFPFKPSLPHAGKYEDIPTIASRYFAEGGEFLYCYWPDPDGSMHHCGVFSRKAKKSIKRAVKTVKKFVKQNPDVLTLVIADHGMIDVFSRDLFRFDDIHQCLKRCVSIDSRTPNFFVKEGMGERFLEAWEKHFGHESVIMSHEEAISSGYFGEGKPNEHLDEFIGDYVAVMLGGDAIYDTGFETNQAPLPGHHAGGDPRERRIAIACFNR